MTQDQADPAAARGRNAALYREVFAINVNGRAVLALLEKKYALPPDLSGTPQAMQVTYLRAAQRDMLDHIHTQIAIAEQLDPPDTPEAIT